MYLSYQITSGVSQLFKKRGVRSLLYAHLKGFSVIQDKGINMYYKGFRKYNV